MEAGFSKVPFSKVPLVWSEGATLRRWMTDADGKKDHRLGPHRVELQKELVPSEVCTI